MDMGVFIPHNLISNSSAIDCSNSLANGLRMVVGGVYA